MQTFKLGDIVAVLHDTISGRIVVLESHKAQIEDEHGFLRSYPLNKLVLQQSKEEYKIGSKIVAKDKLNPKTVKEKSVSPKKGEAPAEIDLHIEELMDYTTHLSNFEIVQIQMTACRSFIQNAIDANLKKVVLIHGKGEGVLKSEIHQYLDRLTSNQGVQIDYYDAPYNEYGMGGATTVSFYG